MSLDFWIFQSTLPARGATTVDVPLSERVLIFQSTLPARGATAEAATVRPY